MLDNLIALKHNKHRIHPCPSDKKISLLHLLLAQNSDLDTVVAVAEDAEPLKELITAANVKVYNDKELLKLPQLKCELLISYDLPATGILYMARLAKATESAIILLDIEEQKQLYPIETLLGRAIKQEIIEGFAYEEQEKMKIAKAPSEKKSFEKPKYYKPKRDGEKSQRKPFEKPKKEGERFDKKPFEKSERKPFDKPKYDKPKRDGEKSERKPFDKSKGDDKNKKNSNKFLGKDENGKAKFSGKSKDRNHRYDGTPKEKIEAPKSVGRKISIKERKPKEEPSS